MPSRPASFDPYANHRCPCRHLHVQHGTADHPSAREGCWWCDCTKGSKWHCSRCGESGSEPNAEQALVRLAEHKNTCPVIRSKAVA